MSDAKREIEKITGAVKDKLKDGSLQYHDFRDHMSLAYKHLKKALGGL
jgi:predicted ribonuclease toxin of YeeF-YezG toxin-antitoxin module